MSKHPTGDGLLLPGLDGTNPLGFLAALGVLQTLTAVKQPCKVTLSWSSNQGVWNPIIYGIGHDQKSLSESLAKHLRCPFPPNAEADLKRETTQKAYDEKKSERKKAADELKKLGLRGEKRKDAEEKKLGLIDKELTKLRSEWLAALRNSVPSLELSLGKHLNATCSELREHMCLALAVASNSEREVLDLYAAFGSDVCSQEKSDQMQATSFCFTTGSGHQYFLDTVRQLVEKVTAERLEKALFSHTEPQDEKCSMRWDPQEDRRYAVMWSDPTASDNKAKTNWALNLLAYRGLQCVPSVPRADGLRTVGWQTYEEPAWNWPIWTQPISSNVVRSLLSHPFLTQINTDRRAMTGLGIVAIYQSIRLQVGNPPLHKVNFAPSRRVL
jgi:hypothetical protein